LVNAIKNILIDDDFRKKLEQNAVNYPYTKELVIKEFEALVEKMV
jgi:hypothetical protein